MFCFSFLPISLIALIAGIAAHMIIGMLWYSPLLFGNLWMSLNKIKAGSYKMHAGHIAGSVITGATTTIVLGHILKGLSVTTCLAALEHSLLLWLGFIATEQFGSVLWEKKPLELYFIKVAHVAVTLAAVGCLVTVL
ncbi:MAG: hypothetical protein QG604_244 [Candidatus Dependentiae bacterium]|nr:hypothetical protein [Candidatus Dependentiae bacterium]